MNTLKNCHKKVKPEKSVPEKRLIPKTYTLMTIKGLLFKYEFKNENPRAWGFMAWLEAREKEQEKADKLLFGLR